MNVSGLMHKQLDQGEQVASHSEEPLSIVVDSLVSHVFGADITGKMSLVERTIRNVVSENIHAIIYK